MKFSDFFIIYLSCGAPFGVYFFLQNRNRKNSHFLYLKSVTLVFVWIPYAIRLLNDFITRRFNRHQYDNSAGTRLDDLQKQISQILFDSDSNVSLFEFREIFERYAGLTEALNSTEDTPSKTDEEIFRVALRQNTKLGAACLHRRNRQRIKFHQSSARQDFLQFVTDLDRLTSDKEKLREHVMEFAKTLNDVEAVETLNNLFSQDSQSKSNLFVKQSEKDLWTADITKQSPLSKVPIRLRALTAARKD